MCQFRSFFNPLNDANKTLSSPIPILTDVKIRTACNAVPPPIKGGQLIYSITEAINELWLRDDITPLMLPTTFRSVSFPNVAILMTPTPPPFMLIPTVMAYSLQVTLGVILDKEKSFSSVISEILYLTNGRSLGLIHIWDPSQSPLRSNLPVLNNTLTTTSTSSFSIGNIPTTLEPSNSLTANARLVNQFAWMKCFMAVLNKAYLGTSRQTVAGIFGAPGPGAFWRYDSIDRGLTAKVTFSDIAFNPAAPLTMGVYVSGMTSILQHMAQSDVWLEMMVPMRTTNGLLIFTFELNYTAAAGVGGGEVATT